MSFLAELPVLSGALVRLEPLTLAHQADAAEEDRTSYAFTEVPRAATVGAYLAAHAERAAAGRIVPLAQVRQADGRAVGCTSYLDPRFWPGCPALCAVEIGWTWLAASAQGTGINTEAKLLLLDHAFENYEWPGSTSRPTPATPGPARPWPGWGPASKVCCGPGPHHGYRGRKAACADQPGPPRRPAWLV